MPTARELGIGIVAYSPLGRGVLSKTFEKLEDLSESDWRRKQPRFQAEVFDRNMENRRRFFEIAERKGCTPAQLSLAWVHAQGIDVFPIPGTKSAARVVENAAAMAISLTPEEMAEIEVDNTFILRSLSLSYTHTHTHTFSFTLIIRRPRQHPKAIVTKECR